MKKLAVLVAVVSIAALAAPALAATNPFMDVPMNHWAYDAIGQLAAHGILSGYPDGLYKGKQQTTRYEMASALARALAVVDMTKASKQDVEMLKRLVVEFKDELEALGVKVAELDERVAVLEDRLGGWKLSGVLTFDVKYTKSNEPNSVSPTNGDTEFSFDEARLFIERYWGEDDEYHFYSRLRDETGADAYFDRFFVEMPFFFDSRLTVGRFSWGWEGAYRVKNAFANAETGSFGEGAQVMTDWTWEGFGFTKNFALGTFQAVLAHPNNILSHAYRDAGVTGNVVNRNWSDWMLMMRGTFQFTEQVGFDLGGVLLIGDNAEQKSGVNTYLNNDAAFDKMWEIYAGLRFNFNDNIAFKGIFYHQKFDMDVLNIATNTWNGVGYNINNNEDDANHWALILDVKQEALKYTSLWLEYGQFDQGFITRNNAGIMSTEYMRNQAAFDTKYWRIAAGQEWNDKWATHLFYYGYKQDQGAGNPDWKPSEFGLGVQYKLNDYTTMGLNYVHVKDATGNNTDDDDQVRFRTSINF